MFIHNYVYSLKTLFKNKGLIFWTFMFPIILATFFNMAFSDISNKEKLDIIDVAFVENSDFNENKIYKEVFDNLSDKNNKDRLFKTRYVSEKKAKELLEDSKIVGYLKFEEEKPVLIINNNGINQTIFKYTVDEISSRLIMVNNLSEEEVKKEINKGNFNIDYEEIQKRVLKLINNKKTNIKDISKKGFDYMMIEFFSLIAMACMYGGMLSMHSINQTLPNLSSKGKRVSVSPNKKSNIILSSLFASYTAQLIGIIILFLYTIFVINVDYGNNVFLVVLLSLIGSLAGLSLGLFISVIFKISENAKTGILISITMIGSFFAGMMGITMKYIIDKNIPLLNKINPVNMITDGLYALYYYSESHRYYFNVLSLVIFSFILIIISLIKLRRQKYDSI